MASIRLLTVATLVAVVSLVGCSGKSTVAPCMVEGTLSYKGKPIPAGSMNFYSSDGTAYSALLSPDGTYTATNLPEGEYVITVDTDSLKPNQPEPTGRDAQRYMKQSGTAGREAPSDMGPAMKKSDAYVKIPAKYAKKASSPLTAKLNSGRNVVPVDLTD